MKTYYSFLSFFICLWSFEALAQVSTEPTVPNANDKVKIIYDATKGSGGLKDCACDVYIHIGAVTESAESTTWSIVPFQWGTTDAKAKMTKVEGQANLYIYELTPNTFFDNPNGLTIYRLGLVFRNGDGSKEGKNSSGGDIFVNLSQGYQVVFTSPNSPAISMEVGESFTFKAETSSPDSEIKFTLDGVQVASGIVVQSLSYTYSATKAGNFELKAEAIKGSESDTETVTIEVFSPSNTAPLPTGAKLGINYLSDTEVLLALNAPGKKLVHVIGDFNDWEKRPDYQMNRTPDGEIFWLKISGLTPAKEYIFQYLVEGEIRIGDPYADKTSDPDHDQEIINQGRYPGLLPYPAGKTQYQATYLQTAQPQYSWKNLTYTKPKPEELVVYELLVRDFDDRRSYNAVQERLDYLQELGINAIELMPVGEFEGNISWGYNPSFFFAPDKYYGTKNDLKSLIDEAHGRGMVIILDMVLNHAFGQNPMVRLYNDGEFGAPTPDNPWFNRNATHPFNVGYDFNHESKYTQAFVDSVNNYWLTEYKIDGFRFDLSKGFTQVVSGSNVGQWSQYDPSRIKIWKHIYDRIKQNHPDAYVILEHLADNSEEKELADYGMMFWGNVNFDFREMAKGQNKDFNWAYYGSRGWKEPNLIAYQESHDEERVMWETLNFGATSPINLKQLENAVNRNQLLTAFYFGIPGPKMIWQFGEFGYDQELNNDRLGIKPTKWNYLDNPQRIRLNQLYQEMIKLKSEHDVFNKPDKTTLNLSGTVKSIILESEEMDVVLHGNFGLTNVSNVSLSFPKTGTWYNYFTGEEFLVNSTTVNFSLRSSEFYLFTDKKLPKPTAGILQVDLITSVPKETIPDSAFKIYPVPTVGQLNVQLPIEMTGAYYRIVDMTGRVLEEGITQSGREILELDVTDIKAGIYIFEAFDTKRALQKRFIKN
ncbi:alpha-amylase family glycosyl hydrolase [Algoriphagus pacificus]|uniref:T9SS type A sorting domain-containing protein n=1 Tax=Algoriphagus pacificus TaxID=2811234 RepID=A0ABS3CH85_9BACT|nr:alpha-amylase family glycosyl hydrolase [Algoriphagus pacificus]MBN7815909.1 T9SS type A sorting domain-containing protein [Algoriphagus pacificus]